MKFSATECLLELYEEKLELEDYQSGVPRWCNGCGDNAILTAIQRLCRQRRIHLAGVDTARPARHLPLRRVGVCPFTGGAEFTTGQACLQLAHQRNPGAPFPRRFQPRQRQALVIQWARCCVVHGGGQGPCLGRTRCGAGFGPHVRLT